MPVTGSIRALRYDRHRRRHGTTVTFRGRQYKVISKPVAGNLTGANEVNTGTLDEFSAAMASRVFDFSPFAFEPFTAESPPTEGETLDWHGWRYVHTHADRFDSAPQTTTAVLFYGIRDITNRYGGTAEDTEGTDSMAITASATRSLSFGGVTVGGNTPIPNAAIGTAFSEVIPANSTDYEVNLPDITVANLVAVGLDASAEVTIKTNNTTTPGQTLTIDTHSQLWVLGDEATNFLTDTTLTTLFITTGAAETTVKGVFVSKRA